MAEKRKRGQNFTAEEKDKLVKLLASNKEVILNKKTDGCTNEAKNRAWLNVTDAFNATTTVYRTKDSLMKVWDKLKTESKLYYQSAKLSMTKTGGGPGEVKTGPILEQVCTLLGRACTGIIGVQDCDANVLDVVENESPIKESFEMCTENTATVEEFEAEKENQIPVENYSTNNTPLWSRRRPRLSVNNERTGAMSSLCTSFQNVNKKKEDIEDLKRQLLQEELEYKRKFYKYSLEAAAKDVEIKNEVLHQLKCGNINIPTVFGLHKENTK
ncbi:uncharacterized protein LOC114250286 isoform X2 [Bombyx mandarina]|uniref:Regulatory protein zeste n=1 Tax=Bombyx mandarina TaxID=7092 RepID=A0A6J2KI60_BOMMA|nr:uncharacterized protein LOC114250286 isoform X2 [Bombyx mandarina]